MQLNILPEFSVVGLLLAENSNFVGVNFIFFSFEDHTSWLVQHRNPNDEHRAQGDAGTFAGY